MSAHGHALEQAAWRDAGSPRQETVTCPDCGAQWTVESRDGGTRESPDGYGLRSDRYSTVVSGSECGCRTRKEKELMNLTELRRTATAAASAVAAEEARMANERMSRLQELSATDCGHAVEAAQAALAKTCLIGARVCATLTSEDGCVPEKSEHSDRWAWLDKDGVLLQHLRDQGWQQSRCCDSCCHGGVSAPGEALPSHIRCGNDR